LLLKRFSWAWGALVEGNLRKLIETGRNLPDAFAQMGRVSAACALTGTGRSGNRSNWLDL
jgi:hypothetical protein